MSDEQTPPETPEKVEVTPMHPIEELTVQSSPETTIVLDESQYTVKNLQPDTPEFELCVFCGQETGRAGKLDDSLYIDELGPFCEECYEDEVKACTKVASLTPESQDDPVEVKGSAIDMPAMVVFHPILGQPGLPTEIPEEHTMWLGANMTISLRDRPLTFGPHNFIISGDSAGAMANQIHAIVLVALLDMEEKNRVVQPVNPGQVPPAPGERTSQGGIVLP